MKHTLALCALLTLSASPVFAHVTANPNNGEAGQYFQTSFRISHGCEGNDTVKVHIKLPPGFVSIRPQHKEGWKVEITKRKLDKPVPAGHGKMADEEFTDITWTGGSLPDAEYDEFGLLMKLPEKPQKLWFPVIQSCSKGENKWTDIPAANQEWHDVKSPAPFVDVTGEEPAAHHHNH